MAKIVTVEQMRAIEAASDREGHSYDEMMERAGEAVARAIGARFDTLAGTRVAILAGGGNNGGDGLVAGLHLAEAGAQVSVYLAKPRPEDDLHLASLRERGLLVAEADQDQRHRVLGNMVTNADILVDALLGTGVKLPLKGAVKEVLQAGGKALAHRGPRPYVVAVDCPSGLDCDTGALSPLALRADLTVTMAAAKAGLLRFPGAEAVGELVIADIGIPAKTKELATVDLELATHETVRDWLPARPKDAHKGTFGKVLVIAGSLNLPGAAGLAALGAYRAGAGLVTVAVPGPVQMLLAQSIPEATWIVLPHEMGVVAEGAFGVLEDELARFDSLLIGPGLGQETATAAFLARLLGASQSGPRGRIGFLPGEAEQVEDEQVALPPMVVDADALKLLTRIEAWPSKVPEGSILTPHPGEMSILTGVEKDEIQKERVETAKEWAAAWRQNVVLKGAFTVVAAPGGRATVLPFATPALARAGTGDVLGGVIAGLLAQGVDAFEAAVLGGFLHGRAGEIAAKELGNAASVLAGDVARSLAAAITELTLS